MAVSVFCIINILNCNWNSWLDERLELLVQGLSSDSGNKSVFLPSWAEIKSECSNSWQQGEVIISVCPVSTQTPRGRGGPASSSSPHLEESYSGCSFSTERRPCGAAPTRRRATPHLLSDRRDRRTDDRMFRSSSFSLRYLSTNATCCRLFPLQQQDDVVC